MNVTSSNRRKAHLQFRADFAKCLLDLGTRAFKVWLKAQGVHCFVFSRKLKRYSSEHLVPLQFFAV